MVNKELCKLCGKPKEEHYYSEKGILCINGFELLGSRFTPLPQDVSIEGERNDLAVYNEGFQKGKLEQKKEDIKLINNLKNPYPRDVFTEPSKEQWDKLQILFEDNNLTQDRYFGSFGRLVFNNIIKQLQKEINSQTEQNSDKEVAQPYSKSDKTTKGFILSDEQFQKEVDFAKKEIGGMRE